MLQKNEMIKSFPTATGKFSVMKVTRLYVFGSCERHSKLTEEIHIPLRPTPKTLFVVDASTNRLTNRNCQTRLLGTWKVKQLSLLRRESVKGNLGIFCLPAVGAAAVVVVCLLFLSSFVFVSTFCEFGGLGCRIFLVCTSTASSFSSWPRL